MGALLVVGTRKGLFSSAGTTSGGRSRSRGRCCPAGRSTMRSSTRATARSTRARTAGSTAAPSSARPTWARPGSAPRVSACPRRAGSSSPRPGISSPGTVRAGHALARRRAGRALPLRRLGLELAGERGAARPRDAGKVGAGRGGLITHSITLDPDDAKRLWIGISAAGSSAPRTAALLAAANQGTGLLLPRRPLPRGRPVRAQGARAPGPPGRLWQQNHRGVYRSDDGGESWERWTRTGCRPASASPRPRPRRPDRAFVIPEEAPRTASPATAGSASTRPRTPVRAGS